MATTDIGISTMVYPTRLYVNGIELRIKIAVDYERDAMQAADALVGQVAAHIQRFEFHPQCNCKTHECHRLACKGECGCLKCRQDYGDFLSSE